MDEHLTTTKNIVWIKIVTKFLNESFGNENGLVYTTNELKEKLLNSEKNTNQIVRRVTNNHLNLIRVTNFNLDDRDVSE